jgi:hypothetical protein
MQAWSTFFPAYRSTIYPATLEPRCEAMYPPLRIAVLECDTPLPIADNRYNGYGGVFTALLKSSAKILNQPDRLDPEPDLQISRWNIMSGIEYPKLEDIDAVLLSGSSSFFLGTIIRYKEEDRMLISKYHRI